METPPDLLLKVLMIGEAAGTLWRPFALALDYVLSIPGHLRIRIQPDRFTVVTPDHVLIAGPDALEGET